MSIEDDFKRLLSEPEPQEPLKLFGAVHAGRWAARLKEITIRTRCK